MNLCIDQGNSSTKLGVFIQDNLMESFSLEIFGKRELTSLLNKYTIDCCIISSVTSYNDSLVTELKKRIQKVIQLSDKTDIPIENRYLTPESLGKDRLAGVIGAAYLKPGNDILVIDAGTAITYDFIDSNQNYWGGNIAPGLTMRLQSLHKFTQLLPIVVPRIESPFLGNSTDSAILSGALYGIAFEIDGYIEALRIKYPQLSTFLTGGSTFYFDTKLKNAIFAERNLVLIGLNRILLYNVQK